MYCVTSHDLKTSLNQEAKATRHIRKRLFTSVAFLALAVASSSSAQEVEWVPNGTTEWHLGDNWVGGLVPAANTNVIINSDLNSGEASPTISTAGQSVGGITIGTKASGGDLTVTSGGTVTVGGPTRLGVAGTGTVRIESGGRVESSGLIAVGAEAGATGNLIVIGTGSKLTHHGSIGIGEQGAGNFNITGGAQYAGEQTVAVGSQGTIRISGGSTFTAGGLDVASNGQVLVGNATASAVATGVNIINTGSIDLAGLLQINQIVDSTNISSFLTLDGPLKGHGEILLANGGLLISGDASGFTGTINLSGNDTLSNSNDTPAILAIESSLGAGARIDGNVPGANKNQLILQGDGSTEVAATIDGSWRSFVKDGTGTTVLSGNNSFVVTDGGGAPASGVEINGGILQIDSDINLGVATNRVLIGDATLATNQTGASGRTISLDHADSAIRVASGTTWDLTGQLTGTGGLNVQGLGTLDITDAISSYAGNTSVTSGATLIGSASTIRNEVQNDGTVRFVQSSDATFDGETKGDGRYVKDGVAELILAAESDTNWEIEEGTLTAQVDKYHGNVSISDGANFDLTGSGTYDWSGVLAGQGDFNKRETSLINLTGDSSAFSGTTNVFGGQLQVSNQLGGDVNVSADAALSGAGTIGGNVSVANGASLIGVQGQTLSIGGDLALNETSVVDVTLGAPGKGTPRTGINDALFDVGGSLALDGTLKITNNTVDAGGFRAGIYRIFDYDADTTLTNGGLEIDPNNTGGADYDQLRVQTSVAGQVNLVNTSGVTMRFWDGDDRIIDDSDVQGGSGTWTLGGLNWAIDDYALNGGWGQDSIAVFQGANGGLVTVDQNAGIQTNGLIFTSNGYEIAGGPLVLTEIASKGYAQLDADQNVTATISAQLVGDAMIDKGGEGTIILTGDNSGYGSDARITNGTLLINSAFGGDVSVGGDQAGQNGALGGVGSIAGDVIVRSGSSLIGNQGASGPLSMGELTLEQGSIVDVTLNAPGNNSGLFFVDGDVNLNGGVIDVTQGADFGRGVYRIIDYTGTRNGEGLSVSADTGGYDYEVQLADADKQINLVVGSNIAFWNGPVENPTGGVTGGTGIWRNDPRTNWTNAGGTYGHAWEQNLYAVLQGQAGTVTVDDDNGAISVGGMQFAIDGYTLVGDAITLNGDDGRTEMRVGDASEEGANYKAIVGTDLTGDSRLVKADLGTLILTGTNTYTGGTTVSDGLLVIGNGGNSGSIQGDALVESGAGFAFDRSNDYSFGGVFTGTGVIGQIGSGTTTLTGDSAVFGGTTQVLNGALHIAGSLGGLINVGDGGLLDGNGLAGDVAVHDGGKIGAGTSTSIGEFHTGQLTFDSGSSYLVNVAADGTGDRIFSSENVIINGGVVDARAGTGDYADQTRYTIITADDGVTRGGTNNGFEGVTSDLAFLTPSLEYDADNVYLVMDRNDRSFCLPGSTANQCATGEGAESTGPGNPIYDAIVKLNDPQALDAFDQTSGEIHATLQTSLLEDSRFVREATGDRIRNAFGRTASPGKVLTYLPGADIKDPTPQPVYVDADKADGPALWSHGFGSWGTFDGDGNAADFKRDVGGLFVGADAPVFDNMRLGVVGGYSHSTVSVDDRNSSASSENFDLGVYGGGQWDRLGVSFGANYTWHNIDTQRSVAFPGVVDSLSADYQARTAQVYGDVGYKLSLGGLNFEPFAGLAYVNLDRDGFQEKGGMAALSGQDSSTDATFTTLGVRLENTFKLGEIDVTTSGMVGWRHTFDKVTPTSTDAFAGGNPFTISGVPLAQDVAVFEAGVNAALNEQLSVGISYSGQFGDGLRDQGLRGNLNWRF